MKKTFKRLRKAFETPHERKDRKAKEFRMAIWRTLWSTVSGIAAIVGLVLSSLIFFKVWVK